MDSAVDVVFRTNPQAGERCSVAIATNFTPANASGDGLFSGRRVQSNIPSQKTEDNIRSHSLLPIASNTARSSSNTQYPQNSAGKREIIANSTSDPVPNSALETQEIRLVPARRYIHRKSFGWLTDDELILLSGSDPANINHTDNNGRTPLMLAIEINNKRLADALLKRGAEITGTKNKNLKKCYAVDYAIRQNRIGMVREWLLKYSYYGNPFLSAIDHNCIDLISRFLEVCPDLTQPSPQHVCPYLYYAVKRGNAAAVEQLLHYGANPDERYLHDSRHETALHLAVEKNNPALTKILLCAGADPDLGTTYSKWSPLIRAAHKGYDQMVGLLLAHQANPDLANRRGATPLRIATHSNHYKVVRQLVLAGASVEPPNAPDSVTSWLESPLGSAIYLRHYKITRLLIKAGARLDKQVFICKRLTPLEKLLQDSFSPEQCSALLQEKHPFPLKYSLQHLCRKVIRSHVRNRNDYKQLPIPHSLMVFCRDRT